MDILQRHMAIQINYLKNSLSNAPCVSTFVRRNKNSITTKVKVTNKDGTSYTLDAGTERGAAFYKIAEETKYNKARLKELLQKWENKWNEPIPLWDSIYKCPMQRSSLLSTEAFQAAESYQNSSFPLDKALMYKNRPYRTKGEIKIVRIVEDLGLDFKYEPCLDLGDGICYPDLWVCEQITGNTVAVEYGGMMEDRKYYDRQLYKRQKYHSSGLREGVDVVFINEYKDQGIEDDLIIAMILSALEQNIVVNMDVLSDNAYIRLSS